MRLAHLELALAALAAEPFAVAFDAVRNNALVGAIAGRGLRDFRKALVRHLAAHGIPVPPYKARPHLSLTYGTLSQRNIAIPPIGWQVDEFLLIRSVHGEGRHEELGRWPLIARQHAFAF